MRRKEEFYCTNCHKYFLTWLRSNFWGKYVIQCPNCNHHHMRIIKEGLVTQERHYSGEGTVEILLGLKATLRDVPYHDDPDFRRSQLRAYSTTGA